MPRKTQPLPRRTPLAEAASMRPRPDAAENVLRPVHGVPVDQNPASMRPRPDAAENIVERSGAVDDGHASMRPRPDAAENARRRSSRRHASRPLQ